MRIIFVFLILCTCVRSPAQIKTEEVTMFSKMPDNDLKGSLIIPASGKTFSLVIIQAGSGPTDRNGNGGYSLKANSYRLLAEELASKNIACLLTDKRGVAASSATLKNEADLRFDDYGNDLGDWIRFVKKDRRFKKVFIAGHSEGSLICMIAAQREKVNGYISIAGAGESIDKIIVWQVLQQSPKVSSEVDSMLARLKNDQKLDSVPPYLFTLLRPSIQPYITSWMKHDPCEEIKKLKAPILIIQGTTDLQVDVKEAENLKACRPDATFKLIEGMNHVLKAAPIDRTKNLATYTDLSLPVIPGLADVIMDFVRKNG